MVPGDEHSVYYITLTWCDFSPSRLHLPAEPSGINLPFGLEDTL